MSRRHPRPAAPGIGGRLSGLVRLTHPFPIVVDAAATAAVAALAGGTPPVVLRLAAGMLLLQAAIGSLNDVIDAPLDAGRKRGKPIPAGLVSRRLATVIAIAAGAAGLALSAAAGPLALAVAGAILAIGLLYDVALKGTPWSWLPFALGIPLLPVYAWAGAAGSVPGLFGLLLPAAFCAGAGLAIANALADLERDRDAGVSSVAVALGAAPAWRLHAALHAVVALLAAASLRGTGAGITSVAVLAVAGTLIGLGIVLAGTSSAARRERGWELEVVGVAILAAGWLFAVR